MTLRLDHVDDVRVSVTFGHHLNEPDEAFLLEVHRPAPPSAGWDERRYVDPLRDVVAALGRADPVPHAVRVTKEHVDWGEVAARAEISVALALPGWADAVDETTRNMVLEALRAMLPPTGSHTVRIGRHQALAVARHAVSAAWIEVVGDELTVSDEEHRPLTQLWSVGMVAADHTRYQVEVGVVDGDPAAVHVRRLRPAEVVDSVGSE